MRQHWFFMRSRISNFDNIMDNILTWPYVKTCIPLFLILVIIEALWSSYRKKGWVRTNDSVSSLSCGIISQITNLLFKSASLASYIWTYKHFAIFDFSNISWQEKFLLIFILFLVIDFAYYWLHRCAHEINIGWAGHVVHHQSEEFNLTTALRQSSTQWIFGQFFFLPIAAIGIPITWKLGINGLNIVYQFFIHTRAIKKLSPCIEFIFNTPSHHRVHHGRNPKYLDKNHGGTLIIWDRLFGTFQEEEEEPIYGTVKPLATFNPIVAQLHYYLVLLKDARRAPNFRDKILIWFKPPGWQPSGLPPTPQPPAVSRKNTEIFNPKNPNAKMALGLFIAGLIGAVTILFFKWPFYILGALSISSIFLLTGAGVSNNARPDRGGIKALLKKNFKQKFYKSESPNL